jgi:hypothetical protein
MIRVLPCASEQTPHDSAPPLAAVSFAQDNVDDDDAVHSTQAKQSSEPPPWTIAEKVRLTASFLECCKALEDPATPTAQRLGIVQEVMRYHIDPEWTPGEIMALVPLMLYYRRKLLDKNTTVDDRVELLKRIYTDREPVWMVDEMVQVHFILLNECQQLSDPEFPLAEKLDILAWLLADDSHDMHALSFYRCARQAWGSCDVRSAASAIQGLMPQWIDETLLVYPRWARKWVRGFLLHNPDGLLKILDKNPQFVNEMIRRLPGWLARAIAPYPRWARAWALESLVHNPERLLRVMERYPQHISEAVNSLPSWIDDPKVLATLLEQQRRRVEALARQQEVQPDLFAPLAATAVN